MRLETPVATPTCDRIEDWVVLRDPLLPLLQKKGLLPRFFFCIIEIRRCEKLSLDESQEELRHEAAFKRAQEGRFYTSAVLIVPVCGPGHP